MEALSIVQVKMTVQIQTQTVMARPNITRTLNWPCKYNFFFVSVRPTKVGQGFNINQQKPALFYEVVTRRCTSLMGIQTSFRCVMSQLVSENRIFTQLAPCIWEPEFQDIQEKFSCHLLILYPSLPHEESLFSPPLRNGL